MLPIPPDIRTLLLEGSMIGADKPQSYVTVGEGAGLNILEDVREVSVSSDLGMAKMATVVIDNSDGKYAPDPAGAWQHVLWPNNVLTIELGYGTELAQDFTGLIDDVIMQRRSRSEAVIRVVARDVYKRALDQTVTDPVTGDRHRTFVSQTPEAILRSLAIDAGWADADIITETTGITLPEYTAFRETYGDIFKYLAELAAFEVLVGRDGKLYYRQATDRQPEAEDEALVLTGTVWTDLANPQVVATSDRVRSAVGGGGTLYSRDTDYEIELGDPARIRRRVGSTIASGATVYATYVYAAWVFEEGVDLVQLDYTISDRDLAPYVLVVGQGERGLEVRAEVDTWLNPYWNLLENKVIIVQADEAKTEAECETIGRRFATRIAQRARQVQLASIGNAWLEAGDCIQLSESTTSASEIYRITSLDKRMSKAGFINTYTAYYYGYSPAPGGV